MGDRFCSSGRFISNVGSSPGGDQNKPFECEKYEAGTDVEVQKAYDSSNAMLASL